MQANFLADIIGYKRELIKKKKSYYDTLKKKVSGEKFNRYSLFKKAISKPDKINLIAEIKKASPSAGLIRDDFDALNIANIYAKNGADAFSILTEDKYFLGKVGYITRVSENHTLPILTKDFILDPGQIYESFAAGTSAILLIVAILADEQLKLLMDVATQFDLDCLVEVHNEEELERALKAGASIIGINNRDLTTFEVNMDTAHKLIPLIPKDKVIVAESGIKTHEDILVLKDAGANAVLIGETFMRSPDIGAKVKEVVYGQS